MYDKLDILAAAVPVFAINNAKTVKDVLDEKVPAVGIPTAATPTLQFSQKKNKNKDLQPA